jgi:hypothetical protein
MDFEHSPRTQERRVPILNLSAQKSSAMGVCRALEGMLIA